MGRKIPPLAKWTFTLFISIFIPTYWIGYGPTNFLWLSDIALFLAFLATLFESRLLASMAAVGGFASTTLWSCDFLFTLFTHFFYPSVSGFTAYMFDPDHPLWLRALSLFHLAAPFLLLWLLFRLGYDKRAWLFQIAVAWLALWTTWFFASPSTTVNLLSFHKTLHLPIIPYVLLECLGVVLLFACTHWFFQRKFK